MSTSLLPTAGPNSATKGDAAQYDRAAHLALNTKTSEAFEHAGADMEAVFHEGTQLERDGKLDKAAEERIEGRLQAISDHIDRQVADDLADIQASRVMRPQRIGGGKVAAIALLLTFIGIPLEFTVGERFVFSYGNSYMSALPTFIALTLPAFAILWLRLEKQQHALSSRYPTWTVRWLIVFPLIIALSSTVLFFSTFGWSALGGWAIGTDAPPRQARVLSIEPERIRVWKCDQKAMLDFNGVQTNICIEDRVIGPALKAGNTVAVRGRDSFLGLFIEEIRVVQSP